MTVAVALEIRIVRSTPWTMSCRVAQTPRVACSAGGAELRYDEVVMRAAAGCGGDATEADASSM